ncbi:Hydrogen cyanide synthase subunit HcnC precursor [Candidatus Izimaplasma bacterium HR1]|jgi:glycerol-3-phosphate dehydrogenase|uniref:FAD-dependent oxidoreductase n=1 Tax=Candidatus Izimoplasma sp. HR1 TaxID=1541959 RepID=UPI0004F6A09E|nr:Hydrogen cyanide synthase subunit HcnC precursor [Candidatus Izimaplasma bacterium HR1]
MKIDKRVQKCFALHREWDKFNIEFTISDKKIITLTGTVDVWQELVDIGHIVAKVKGVKNLVNNITAKDTVIVKKDYTNEILETKKSGKTESCDVVIIGAGVSGCAIARELSKYDIDIKVIEKNSDISDETSKANNGNIHPGFLATPGTLKAKLNLRGNYLYTKLSNQLDFDLKRPGSLIVYYDEKNHKKFSFLKLMKRTGLGYFYKPIRQMMKVPGLKWLTGEEVHELEPNIKGKPLGGLWMTTMGIVEPFQVCYALSENAIDNGVEFKMNTRVLDIEVDNSEVTKVITNNEVISCKTVINAAGVYADDIAEMVNDKFYTIHARRGAIAILDKNRKGFIRRPSGSVTNKKSNSNSKGGGASVTPEGNLLWGPTAVEISDKEDKAVYQTDLEFILSLGSGVTDEVKANEIITIFSGLRAADYKEDFIIEASKKVKGFIHVSGIQSPGLASAPAIAERVEKIYLKHNRGTKTKSDYTSVRTNTPKFRDYSHKEQDKLIEQNPKYGRIICRCESITEGEIIDACNAAIPATSVDAVKRRSRAGMGRCQGGFCGPKVLEIISRELNIPMTEVTLKGGDSKILTKDSRG